MKIVTSAEMKELERLSIQDFGLSEELLMERAGLSVLDALWRELGGLVGKNFLVVCGSGNNGGDGYVVARDLLNHTEAVKVVAVDEPKSEVTRLNYERFLKHGGVVDRYDELGLKRFSELVSAADVVVDALFGTGLTGSLRGQKYVDVIETINFYSRYTVAVDVPSGIDADTGKVLEHAIQANLTVTFAYPKPGHFLYPGRQYVGKLKVAHIGIPSTLLAVSPADKFLLTEETVARPQRPKWAHKGYFKEVIVVGGSKRYRGAPVLSALGALKAGAGMVKLVSDSEVCRIALTHDPSLICVEADNASEVLQYLRTVRPDAVIVVGPGWSLEDEEGKLEVIKFLLSECQNNVILDADALNIVSQRPSVLLERNKSKYVIVTPHPGEFSKLSGKPLNEIKENYEEVRKFAAEHDLIVVLKDATTIISNGATVYFNVTGNSSLSKAGSGDVLAGVLAGLLSQHLDPLEATKLAVYKFGLAGESIEREGFNSSFDVLQRIPSVL